MKISVKSSSPYNVPFIPFISYLLFNSLFLVSFEFFINVEIKEILIELPSI
jgi:hypothetical protein